MATAAADFDGLLCQVIEPTRPERGIDAVIGTIVDTIKEAATSAGASKSDIRFIGIGSPGPIDPKTGMVIFAPNLMWHNVPIVRMLEGILDLPVCLENDANVAALGEYQFGAGRRSKNMVYITVSTGVGGGLILDGKIYAGSFGMAGEVGHMTIVADGPLCGCGNQGCLEALASGPAIARKARACVLHGQETTMTDMVSGKLEEITSKTVGEAAAAGDVLAKEIVDKAGEYVGIAVANLINIINPDTIVIGGGVSNMGELILEPLRKAAGRRAMKAAFDEVRIVKAELGSDAGVVTREAGM